MSFAAFALAAALLGGVWLDARNRPRVLILVDRSSSMPAPETERALAATLAALRRAGAEGLQRIDFAGRPAAPVPAASTAAPPAAQAPASVDPLLPQATNLEAALVAAAAADAQAPFAGVVLISDGLASAGDTERGLRLLRGIGLPLQWIAVGRAAPEAQIGAVLAPERARLGERIRIRVQVDQRPADSTSRSPGAATTAAGLRVEASARHASGDLQRVRVEPDSLGRATIDFDARRPGPWIVDLALQQAGSGANLASMPDAAVVEVLPRASVLYVQGRPGREPPLAGSLRRGGWRLDLVASHRLDALVGALEGYRSVVLDDVAVDDASPRFWRSLTEAVRQRGLGLLALGGERSFARGGYAGSTLESVLPLAAAPPALTQPASVVFLVDKSGSMGTGSAGVDRFQLAQAAVRETARGLGERDSMGLVVFDVAPRVLIPLGAAATQRPSFEHSWPVRPRGGTRIGPALQAAIAEFEHAPAAAQAARRILVLVTDGFVDATPPAALRAQLEHARIQTLAIAVGPDADVPALAQIVGARDGAVLHADEAAELPQLMRSGLALRRARIERGLFAVEQRGALPFEPASLSAWPPVAAHAVTLPAAGAVVVAQTERAEPLIAYRQAGRGRVIAVSCGLGPWVPQWLGWSGWPGLVGGMVNWVEADGGVAAESLAVSDTPDGLQLDAEPKQRPGRTASGGSGTEMPAGPLTAMSVEAETPGGLHRELTLEAVAPGHLRATLPNAGTGLYAFSASSPGPGQHRLHLVRQRSEDEAWGIHPSLPAWKAAGLVGDWNPSGLLLQGQGHAPAPGLPDRSLIVLALVLFLAAVGVDRAHSVASEFRRLVKAVRGIRALALRTLGSRTFRIPSR